ncbi:MAG TPA: BlaI/MecI/CopY family transcriptional regulator [Verrucomicrobiae bacterium]|nr:BlaI/MecI/CopY family transcriptional regulator [Verrucomicrobiae bacterium]
MAESKPITRKPRRANLPKISDAEWVVMRALWANTPMTTNQVVDALNDTTHWKPKTIHTLLSRLVRKGALEFERQGREHLFRPLVTAAECEHAATRSFLGRFFDGELAPFLARFLETEKLKPSEIEELKRILERKAS